MKIPKLLKTSTPEFSSGFYLVPTSTNLYSHRRLTAQAIAGRLYEGLKNDYKCFLDSETQFKIHDLETIVKNTSNYRF